MSRQAHRRPRTRPVPDDTGSAEGIDFKAIVESATDVILFHGPDIIATYMSPSITALIGRTPEEMVGRCHMEHILPADMPGVLKTIAAHEKGQMDGRIAFRMMHKNGSTVWVEGSGRVLRDPDTGEERWVVVLRDISDRKALEAQLTLLALTNEAPRARAAEADRMGERGAGRLGERQRPPRNAN